LANPKIAPPTWIVVDLTNHDCMPDAQSYDAWGMRRTPGQVLAAGSLVSAEPRGYIGPEQLDRHRTNEPQPQADLCARPLP
jgi:hypothetical protein